MKMKSKLFLLVFLLLIGAKISIAQTQCGTESSIDKVVEAIYLAYKNDLDQTRMPDSIQYKIPIQFHMIRGDDGLSDFEPRFVDSILLVLNSGFANTPFEFYSCDEINYINDDDYETIYYYSSSAGQDLGKFFNFYNSDKAINVYLPNSIFAINASAWAYFPWGNNHSYVIPWSGYNSKTHIHEMGHLLGLYHTHTYGELADGTNCKTAGDLCCDTPAEPKLNENNNVANCEYVGTALDPAGQPYNPDVGNHMSYAPHICRTFFTSDQIDRMTYFYNYFISKYQCDDNFEYTDIYFDKITTTPYPAVEGQPYSIYVRLQNSGNVEARHVKVKITMDNIKLGSKSVFSVYTYTPGSAGFVDREAFPHEAGRYLICAETEGDSLEINPLNNKFCQEILVRQEEGIPDLIISELKLRVPQGEQNALNPISFKLENLGSIKAEQLTGKIFVEGILVDSFMVNDIEIADKAKVNLLVPLKSDKSSDICIKMDPAYTEERLDNNDMCISFGTTESLFADLEIDSISLIPNDSLLIPEKSYKLYFRYKNNGPGIAWDNSSFLHINSTILDSTHYFFNAGWHATYTRIDSFEFVVPNGISNIDLCAEFRTYRDTVPENNSLCMTRPVDGVSDSKDIPSISKLKVYPNPVAQNLTIETESIIKNVTIYNNLGKHISSTKNFGSNKITLNLAGLHTGFYHLVIESNNGRFNETIVKL